MPPSALSSSGSERISPTVNSTAGCNSRACSTIAGEITGPPHLLLAPAGRPPRGPDRSPHQRCAPVPAPSISGRIAPAEGCAAGLIRRSTALLSRLAFIPGTGSSPTSKPRVRHFGRKLTSNCDGCRTSRALTSSSVRVVTSRSPVPRWPILRTSRVNRFSRVIPGRAIPL